MQNDRRLLIMFTPYIDCCDDTSCACIPVDREESNGKTQENHHGAVGKL